MGKKFKGIGNKVLGNLHARFLARALGFVRFRSHTTLPSLNFNKIRDPVRFKRTIRELAW